jgi:hypothetical protein
MEKPTGFELNVIFIRNEFRFFQYSLARPKPNVIAMKYDHLAANQAKLFSIMLKSKIFEPVLHRIELWLTTRFAIEQNGFR